MCGFLILLFFVVLLRFFCDLEIEMLESVKKMFDMAEVKENRFCCLQNLLHIYCGAEKEAEMNQTWLFLSVPSL